jgi:hypothetical protein
MSRLDPSEVPQALRTADTPTRGWPPYSGGSTRSSVVTPYKPGVAIQLMSEDAEGFDPDKSARGRIITITRYATGLAASGGGLSCGMLFISRQNASDGGRKMSKDDISRRISASLSRAAPIASPPGH